MRQSASTQRLQVEMTTKKSMTMMLLLKKRLKKELS
jgi:hypothetical protein